MFFLICKYVLGWVTACEIVRKIYVAQALLTVSLPNVEPTYSCDVGVSICKISGI